MDKRIEFARRLRREQSDVEDRMWTQLRGRRFCDLKFRRQVPMGRYTVDFMCETEKLVVEVDGWQHTETQDYDEVRSRYIETQGYRIIRFWSDNVRYRMDDVLDELREVVGDATRE